MKQFVRVAATPSQERYRELAARTAAWKARGYSIRPVQPDGRTIHVLVPLEDSAFRSEFDDATAAGDIDEWRADWVEQSYTSEEIEAAPLFQLFHTGRDIQFSRGKDLKFGVCHLTSIDDSNACGQCGAGARQGGPLRLSGAELNKCGRFGSIWLSANAFFLLAESLVAELEKETGSPLPRRHVEITGKTAPKEPWWQLDPQVAVPPAAIREHWHARHACPQCGTIRLTRSTFFGGHFTADRGALPADLPSAVLSHYAVGDLTRFPDGRVISYPGRLPWLRGDAARALRAKKVRGLDLNPVLYGASGIGS